MMYPKILPGSLDSVIQQCKDVQYSILWLKCLNRFLMGVIGVVVLYGLWDFYEYRKPYTREPFIKATDFIELTPTQEKAIPLVKIERDLFSPYVSQEQIIQDAAIRIEDIKNNYRIVGIMLGQEPQVIMENQKNQKTSFLKLGDKMEEAFVEDIQMDRILFTLRGQIFEIES